MQPLLQLLWLQQRYVRARKCPGKWHPTPTPSRLPRQDGVVFIRGLPICPVQPLVSTGRKPWLKSIPSGRCSSQLHGGKYRPSNSLKWELRSCVARSSTMRQLHVPQCWCNGGVQHAERRQFMCSSSEILRRIVRHCLV